MHRNHHVLLVTWLDFKKKKDGLVELIVLVNRAILLKSGPGYRSVSVEKQSEPMVPSVRALEEGRLHKALHCLAFPLPDTHLES